MSPLPPIYILCSDEPTTSAPRFHGAFYSIDSLEDELWMRVGLRMGQHRPHVYHNALDQVRALEPNTSVSFSGDEDGTTWYHVYLYEAWTGCAPAATAVERPLLNPHPLIHAVAVRDPETAYVTFHYVGPFAEEAEDAMRAATPNTFTLCSMEGYTG